MKNKTMCIGGGYLNASPAFERGLLPHAVRTLKLTGDASVVLIYQTEDYEK